MVDSMTHLCYHLFVLNLSIYFRTKFYLEVCYASICIFTGTAQPLWQSDTG